MQGVQGEVCPTLQHASGDVRETLVPYRVFPEGQEEGVGCGEERVEGEDKASVRVEEGASGCVQHVHPHEGQGHRVYQLRPSAW